MNIFIEVLRDIFIGKEVVCLRKLRKKKHNVRLSIKTSSQGWNIN
jgi:hypothetical protein